MQLHKCKLVRFVATHVTSEKNESHGLVHLVRKQNAVFVINVTQASIRMETTTRREHFVHEHFCLQHTQLLKCWRRLRVRQCGGALQFVSTCVVRLVRHTEEHGAVSQSCGVNILFCSSREKELKNVGRTETMWDEKNR